MSKNDGGPAFPQQGATIQMKDDVYFLDKGGMSLRDWFAGMALQGLIASPMRRAEIPEGTVITAEYYVEKAYLVADAMLEARNK